METPKCLQIFLESLDQKSAEQVAEFLDGDYPLERMVEVAARRRINCDKTKCTFTHYTVSYKKEKL